jgi:hypothetical protein
MGRVMVVRRQLPAGRAARVSRIVADALRRFARAVDRAGPRLDAWAARVADRGRALVARLRKPRD